VRRNRLVKPPPSLSVLIADDWEDTVELTAQLLRFAGHATRIAYDGLEALRILREFDPGVVWFQQSGVRT
jgi:CheY-like chemotaxis protein